MVKQGWLSSFYPNSGYEIINNSVVFTRTNLGTNQYNATANAIETSYGYDKQTGGKLKTYKLSSTNHDNAFKTIQERIVNGKIFHKNKLYLVSVSDLDTKNKLYKVYKK